MNISFDAVFVLVAIAALVVAVGVVSGFAFWYADSKAKSWKRKLAWLLLLIPPAAAWFMFSNIAHLVIPGILLGTVIGLAWRKSQTTP